MHYIYKMGWEWAKGVLERIPTAQDQEVPTQYGSWCLLVATSRSTGQHYISKAEGMFTAFLGPLHILATSPLIG